MGTSMQMIWRFSPIIFVTSTQDAQGPCQSQPRPITLTWLPTEQESITMSLLDMRVRINLWELWWKCQAHGGGEEKDSEYFGRRREEANVLRLKEKGRRRRMKFNGCETLLCITI